MECMKSLKLGSLILVAMSASAFAQSAPKKTREPSAKCDFQITTLAVHSGSATKEVDHKNKKLVKSFNYITDFSQGIPKFVRLKMLYKAQGCKPVAVARIKLIPNLRGQKDAQKPWYQSDIKIEGIKNAGEILVNEDIPVYEHFAMLGGPDQAPQSLTFDVVVQEDGRDVAAKSVTLDATMGD